MVYLSSLLYVFHASTVLSFHIYHSPLLPHIAQSLLMSTYTTQSLLFIFSFCHQSPLADEVIVESHPSLMSSFDMKVSITGLYSMVEDGEMGREEEGKSL